MNKEEVKQAVIISLETANKVSEFLGKCPWNDVQHFLGDFLLQARTTLHELKAPEKVSSEEHKG